MNTTQEKPLAIPQAQPPSLASILEGVVRGGVTPENVAAVKEIIALQKDMMAMDAQKAFTADMVRLKQALAKSPVKATKMVPNNDGTPRYHFAPLQEIDSKLAPIALEHGFTYSFSEGPTDPGKVAKICVVQHIGGHSKSNPYTVRVAPVPKATDTQNDGAAHSYAKRGALCDAFGIIAEQDTDGASDNPRDEGHPITQAQADQLRELCDAAKADRKKFLAAAKAESFEAIMSANYGELCAVLQRRIAKNQEQE